jgi:hypothetical protein
MRSSLTGTRRAASSSLPLPAQLGPSSADRRFSNGTEPSSTAPVQEALRSSMVQSVARISTGRRVSTPTSDVDPLRHARYLSSVLSDQALTLADGPDSSNDLSSESDDVRT